MGDMWVHQCTKGELNQFRDGTEKCPNACTCFPLHKLYFYHKSMHFILEYLSIYIYSSRPVYKGERKFPSLQTSHLTLIHTL